MKKYNIYIVYFWLTIGILTTIYAIYKTMTSDEVEPMTYYMPILAFVLFGMRKWYDGKLKKQDQENGEK
ncbi:MAG: hypothetical protein CL840_12395 [Crocinitomicaceae bacterium]|nr:hypothetical protein [Crocinitomicaceae bacterium]|tara:strand:+ start:15057 stop:15263 length:207 start_codon:yes stop_codon:yes gene_type:complete